MRKLIILLLMVLLVVGIVACDKPVENYTLTLNKSGEGTLEPTAGSYEYNGLTVVDLTAVAADSWQFVSWNGGVVEQISSETTILMDSDKTVEAIFVEETDPNYLIFDSSSGTITDYDKENGGPDVVIPSEISGVSVVSIGDEAFDTKLLESVIIPDSVTSIGEDAFASNGPLSSLKIGSNVSTIGNGAFQLGSLEEVILPDGLISIGDFAFLENPLTSIVFPDSVSSIGMFAFAYNSNLESITIGDGVDIGMYVFAMNDNFKEAYDNLDSGGAGTYNLIDGDWIKE